MKVIVCGGRTFSDRAWLFDALDKIHAKKAITLLINGGANGADSLAAEWAASRGVPSHTEYAKWRLYGKSAGARRNRCMLVYGPVLVIAFPGGPGTANMCELAEKAGVRVLKVKKEKQ